MTDKRVGQTDAEKQLLDAIRNIKYGAVEVHIHDSKIVQIEERKKFRF
jgi:hypothetical protein